MNSYDNIRHDISDASFCVTTAIELLSGMEQDNAAQNQAMRDLIAGLERVRNELEGLGAKVTEVEQHVPA